MKRRGFETIVLVLVLTMLAGCGGKDFKVVSDNVGETIDAEAGTALPGAAVRDGEDTGMEVRTDTGLYAYALLETRSDREIYNEILAALTERRMGRLSPDVLQEQVEQNYLMVMADHPELFYVTGFDMQFLAQPSANADADDSGAQSLEVFIRFTGKEELPSEEIVERRNALKSLRNEVLANLSENAGGNAGGSSGEYEKAKQIYEYVILHTIYGGDAGSGQTADCALLDGKAVCTGYARATQYLLQGAGISSTLVTGRKSGRSHAWLLVRLDGEYYYMDPTEGNSLLVNMPSNYRRLFVNYAFFAMTSEDIAAKYADDGFLPLPDCTAQTDSYFARENSYIASAEEQVLEEILQRPVWTEEEGLAYRQFRCAKECYEEARARLTAEESPVMANGWICVSNDEMNVLTFYRPVGR